jgi:hypothetical protein
MRWFAVWLARSEMSLRPALKPLTQPPPAVENLKELQSMSRRDVSVFRGSYVQFIDVNIFRARCSSRRLGRPLQQNNLV